ncbi:hypothetical protein JL721_2799 [Aureococcus anophagefferens]|nr:hypothetical protein JL721_2799 [Aureococcus anophagefferens]
MADADKVWVPSKTKVWQLATVDAWKQSTVEVTTAEGQRETLDQAKAARWDPSHDGDIDDLAKMNQLHEAPLLTALGRRYKRDAIYTYTGDVLVSVNPYKSIPLLYDLPAVDDEEAFEAMDASRPHVYGIARRAQAAVRATRVNQSVVVSGESGAGKTEASKKVMAFLLALSAARKDAYAEAAVDVDAVLMVSNVILEAFGNAKTIRNDNSSRFGQVKAKALPDNSLDDFPLLVAGGVTEIDDHHTVDDAKEFDASCGCSQEERARVAGLVGGLLRLGALTFDACADDTGLVAVGGDVDAVARALGLDGAVFMAKLRSHSKSSARGSVVMIPYGDREAKENADALVKFLYGALFDWLLRKLNAEHGRNVASKTFEPFVGILDIFGFEILPTNSFEQLCINFANEMLQRQFNATVFERERAVYESEAVSEGLDPGYVAFDDNRDLVDVVTGAKPAGLFPILEEHGLLHRKPDDKALLRAYHDAHAATPEPKGGKPRAYAKPRFDDGLHFQLRHYAGAVDYDVSGWIVKNNDALAHDLRDAVEASDDGFLRHCLRLPGAPEAGAGRIDGEPIARDAGPRDKKKMAAGQTVSKKFRTQLEELVAILATTSPHYIKCIKPNSSKQPGAYSEQLVVKQLRCSGALEVVRIRREGLPTRVEFLAFTKSATRRSSSPAGEADLQAAVDALYGAFATKINAKCAGKYARTRFRAAKRGFSALQSLIRGSRARGEAGRRKKRLKDEAALRRRLAALRQDRDDAVAVAKNAGAAPDSAARDAAVAASTALDDAADARGPRAVLAGARRRRGHGREYGAAKAALDAAADAVAALRGAARAAAEAKAARDLEAVEALKGAAATRASSLEAASARLARVAEAAAALEKQGDQPRADVHAARKALDDALAAGAAARKTAEAAARAADDALAKATAPEDAAAAAGAADDAAAAVDARAAAAKPPWPLGDAPGRLRGRARGRRGASGPRATSSNGCEPRSPPWTRRPWTGASPTPRPPWTASRSRRRAAKAVGDGGDGAPGAVAEAAAAAEACEATLANLDAARAKARRPRAEAREALKRRRDRRAVSAAAATTDAAPFRVDGVVRNKAMAAQVSAARDGVARRWRVAAAPTTAATRALRRGRRRRRAGQRRRGRRGVDGAARREDGQGGGGAHRQAPRGVGVRGRSRDRSSVRLEAVSHEASGEAAVAAVDAWASSSEALAATLAEARRLVTVAEDGDVGSESVIDAAKAAERFVAGQLVKMTKDTDAKASRAALVIALEREGASADETAAQAERHAAAAELAEHAAGGDAYAATASAALSAAVVARLQACRRRAGRDGLGGPELGGRVRNLDAAALAAVDAAERALGDGTTLDSSSLERTTTGVEAAEKACGEATAARRAEERKVVDAARKSLEESAAPPKPAVQDKEAKEHALVAAGHADLMKLAERLAAAKAKADAELGVDFALDGDVDDGVRASDAELVGLALDAEQAFAACGDAAAAAAAAGTAGGAAASQAAKDALHAAADATAALEAEVARSVDARVPAAVKIESVARMAPSAARGRGGALRRGAFRRAGARAATKLGRFVRSILRTAHLLAELDAAFDLAAEAGVPVDASSPLFAGDDPWALLTTCRHPRRGLQTLAHAAAFGGNASLFELLLPRLDGAALLARDRRGDTPLHCAARATRLDLARAILGGLDRSSTTAAVAPSKLRRASLFGDFRRSGEDAAKAAAKPGVVHCGRMRKRKEGDAWKERWCVLSDTSLSYYGKKSDAKPIKSLSLRNASVKRSDVKPYAFEVHSAQMLQLGNKAGRMYFACEAPEDLFEWLGAFRETVALCHAYTVGVGAGDATFANLELRAAACAAKNRRGEAALHCACETVDATAPSARAVQLALHLLQFGAALDARRRGPHAAGRRRRPRPRRPRGRPGRRRRRRRRQGSRRAIALDRCSASFAAALARKGGSVEKSTHAPLLGPPPLRHKCTYCRAIFDKLSLDGADKLHHPFLAISVRDAKGRDVERVQHATAPPLTRSGYLLFGKTWCLQSAVEDLDFGCFVLVELFDRAPSAKKAGRSTTLWWRGRLDLNAKLFESSRDSLEFFLPPRRRGDAAPAHMFLSLDVYLAKLGDEGDARPAPRRRGTTAST